ncbi:MAG: hypothetical protein ACYSWP_11950 [Planctomycetota bacterium]
MQIRKCKFVSLGVVFVTFFCVISVCAGERQWLGYRTVGEGQRNNISMDGKMLDVTEQRPADVCMPDFNSVTPLFAKWETPMVEGGYLWVALDSEGKKGIRNLIYIDSDGDGRLDDETALFAYWFKVDRNTSRFQGVKVVFSGEDGPITYHLHFTFGDSKSRRYLRAVSGCWYEGVISVGGDKKICVLYDNNANGTFNDKSDVFSRSDRITIGKQVGRDAGFVGNFIDVDGVLYDLEVARDGAYVELTKAENVEFGEVRLQETISEFAAGGVNVITG